VDKNTKIVFFGAGAIGASVGAWLVPHHSNTWFVDQGAVKEAMKSEGITVYQGDSKENTMVSHPVNVVEDLSELKDADIIFLGVKNYSLEPVAKMISDITGDRPLIISMANGAENQKILPKYFSRVVYAVISYNAWMDKPVVVGYQKKGPVILGTPDNSLTNEMNDLAELLGKGVETVVTGHLEDAVHCKIVVNLTNSLTTLIGHGFKEVSDMDTFQKLLTNTLYEGVQVISKEGYRECQLGGMPTWSKMKAGAKLPLFLTRGMFRNNVSKMVMSSMSQDIIQRGGMESELGTINGYIINMADKNNLDVPYNRAIYKLCQEKFTETEFKPLDVKDVWTRVQELS
jgi:2-dehydropantoate 2-reductase